MLMCLLHGLISLCALTDMIWKLSHYHHICFAHAGWIIVWGQHFISFSLFKFEAARGIKAFPTSLFMQTQLLYNPFTLITEMRSLLHTSSFLPTSALSQGGVHAFAESKKISAHTQSRKEIADTSIPCCNFFLYIFTLESFILLADQKYFM